MKNKKTTVAREEKGLKSSLDFTKTWSDQIAVGVINALGSMAFLIGCLIFFLIWISWNSRWLGLKPFDPFPFPILEMMVSLFAIILSVSVLINQKRQGRIEKIRQQVEFEVNIKAEDEITKVLILLHEIHQKLDIGSESDAELEEMKKSTDLKKLQQTIDEKETRPK
jgi:uncharacterized membrane protein